MLKFYLRSVTVFLCFSVMWFFETSFITENSLPQASQIGSNFEQQQFYETLFRSLESSPGTILLEFGSTLSKTQSQELILSEFLLPHFHKMDVKTQKFTTFEQYLAGETPSLSDNFFQTPPFMHPSGHSYALLYLKKSGMLSEDFENQKAYPTLMDIKFLKTWLQRLHIRERTLLYQNSSKFQISIEEQTLLKIPLSLYQEVTAGTKSLNWQANHLFLLRDFQKAQSEEISFGSYLAVPSKLFLSHLRALNWDADTNNRGVVTFRKAPTTSNLFWQFFILFSLFLLLAFYCFVLVRKTLVFRKEKSQLAARHQFGFEVLSHELRTPLTGIQLALSELESDYSKLSPVSQRALLELQANEQKVLRTLDAAHGLLFTGLLDTPNPAQELSIIDAVNDIVEALSINVEVRFVGDIESPLNYPSFWFATCLNNLIKNADFHGKHPITLLVECHSESLSIQVQDSGVFLKKRFPKQSNRMTQNKVINMGLGLRLVSYVVEQWKGKLTVKHNPTRVRFELPRRSY